MMAIREEIWAPGSFTKNFSWGTRADGLSQLYHSIKLGYNNSMEDVPRSEFLQRVSSIERPGLIPANFFLFNKVIGGVDCLIADELVFQALNSEYSPRFDKLALFAFNFSFAGKWANATPDQRRPALWAYHYVKDRVAGQLNWNTTQVSADDIETFIRSDSRYKAKTTRKLSTNLSYLYSNGRLSELVEQRVERWWVDALFLALDRLIEDRGLDGLTTSEQQYAPLLHQAGFQIIGGKLSLEKELAITHLVALYIACGGRDRFSEECVKERTLKLPDVAWILANDPRPKEAVHPTNPRILKSIPRACAMLARYAGFEVIDAEELESFDIEEFVRRHTRDALKVLRERNVASTMSVEELMRITRDK